MQCVYQNAKYVLFKFEVLIGTFIDGFYQQLHFINVRKNECAINLYNDHIIICSHYCKVRRAEFCANVSTYISAFAQLFVIFIFLK